MHKRTQLKLSAAGRLIILSPIWVPVAVVWVILYYVGNWCTKGADWIYYNVKAPKWFG